MSAEQIKTLTEIVKALEELLGREDREVTFYGPDRFIAMWEDHGIEISGYIKEVK